MRRAFGIPATTDLDRAARIAVRVEELGFATLWTNDTSAANGIATAGAMGEAAENLRIGIGVVAATRRTAAEVVESVRSHDIDLARLVIGVGSGPSPQPLRAVRSMVEELRTSLGPDARIGVAAMGPQMCRLAGELADTVLLNWMVPERIEWARSQIARGADRSGRDGLPEVASYVRAALGDDSVERVGQEAANYNRYPAYAKHFAAQGVPLSQVGVADAVGPLPRQIAEYDRVLDEVVVRALPASDSIASTLAVAVASAPVNVA